MLTDIRALADQFLIAFPNINNINSWEILENKLSNKCHRHKIIETNLSLIDNHDETPLEF